MKLVEILVNLPIEELQGIAYRHGFHVWSYSKAELIRQLLINLADRDRLNAVLNQLPPGERELVNYLLASRADFADSGRTPDGHTPVAGDPQNRPVIEFLREHGLIYRVQGKDMIPNEIGESLLGIFRKDLPADLFLEPPPGLTIRHDGRAFYYDLYTFLTYLNRNPVRLTRLGSIFSRNLQRIMSLFILPESSVESTHESDAAGDTTGRFHLLLEWCRHRRMVKVKENNLVIGDTVAAWMAREPIEQIRDVFDGLRDSDPLRDLDSVRAINLLRTVLSENAWISAAKFAAKIGSLADQRKPEEVSLDQRICRNVIMPLTWLGLLESGSDPVGENLVTFRVTDLGRCILDDRSENLPGSPATKIVVQPNFELIVPQDLPFRLRWQLDQFTFMVASGNVARYALTKESAVAGYKSGFSVRAMLAILAGLTSDPLPQNVEQTILDWSETFGVIGFAAVTVLHCETPTVAAMVRSIPSLQGKITTQLTPLDLVIEAANIELIRSILESNDIVPIPGVGSSHLLVRHHDGQ